MNINLLFLSVLSVSEKAQTEPFHQVVPYVDINRFSGDWHVIALIPTSFEKGAEDGIENYSFDGEGNIRVVYTFKKGKRELKERVMTQKGWIIDNKTNAEWQVRPLWPLKLPYYIMELDEDYSYTVIGTNNYKYLWIMARTATMDQSLLHVIIERMVQRGFDRDKIILMKQNGA